MNQLNTIQQLIDELPLCVGEERYLSENQRDARDAFIKEAYISIFKAGVITLTVKQKAKMFSTSKLETILGVSS